MPLVATLGLSLALADSFELPCPRVALRPAAPATLAARITAERARLPAPAVVAPPPRFSPILDALHESTSCSVCRLIPVPRPGSRDPADADAYLVITGHAIATRDYHQNQAQWLLAEPRESRARARHLAAAARETPKILTRLTALISTPHLLRTHVEEGLYLMVREQGLAGHTAEAEAAHRRLAQEFPGSRYLPHADDARAHHALARGEPVAARELFKRVLAGPDALHARAHVAIGWSHLPARPDLALAAFERAHVQLATTPLVDDAAALRRSVEDGLLAALAARHATDEAADLLDRLIDRPRADALLARLALTYFADEQHAHGIAVHRILLASLPEAPERCDWQTRIVLASSQQTDHAATIREAERLADVWLSMRDGNDRQAVKRRCRDAALEILPELAMRWHDAADETGDPASHARSERLYTTFLGVFPLAIEARAVRAWLADLQWSHAARMADYPPTRDAARRMFAAVAVAFTALFVDRPEHIDVHTLARAAEHARCNARALRDAP